MAALTLAANMDFGRPAISVLQGVANQILQELTDLPAITGQRRQLIMSHHRAAFLNRHLQIGQHGFQESPEFHRRKFLAAGADARVREQISDQAMHQFGAVHRVGDILVGILVELAVLTLGQKLRVPDDHAQRFL